MNKIILKHSMTDARDCRLDWEVDFAKMTFTMRMDFISPFLLLHWLHFLDQRDERFQKTGIIGAIAITSRFKTLVELPSGTVFQVRAYQPFSISETRKEPLALELFEMQKD